MHHIFVCMGFEVNKAEVVVKFWRYSSHQTIVKCPSLFGFQVNLEFIIAFVFKQ